jgi:hypothetical protein
VKQSSQVRITDEFACEETRKLPGECPACGQRIDPANRLCPRCRLWLLPLPAHPPRQARVTRAAGVAVLALASVAVGLVVYLLLSEVPRDVVLPDDEVASLPAGE